MTKERFIQLLEQKFDEEKNDWNADEEMSEVSQDIFNTVEAYIEVLRKSDESKGNRRHGIFQFSNHSITDICYRTWRRPWSMGRCKPS